MVVCGDWFHSGWKPHRTPPELINAVIGWWGNFTDQGKSVVYSVPGNHDLPYHRYDDKRKSAYWTLVQAGVVNDLPPNKYVRFRGSGRDLLLEGFPWGFPPGGATSKLRSHETEVWNVAVVHDYCWSSGNSHPGAPPDKHGKSHAERLTGFDFAFFGDNHNPFSMDQLTPKVYNCGGFMNRNADERGKECGYFVLWSDKTVTRESFEGTEKWDLTHDVLGSPKRPTDFSGFLDLLAKDPKKALDFADVFARALDRPEVAEAVRLVGLACLEEAQR